MCSKKHTLSDVYRWVFGVILGDEDVSSLLRSYQKQINAVMFKYCLCATASPLFWLPLKLYVQPAPLFTRELGGLGLCAVRDVLLVAFLIKKSLKHPNEDVTSLLRMFGRGDFEVITGKAFFREQLRLRAIVGARVICCNFLGKGIWFDESF